MDPIPARLPTKIVKSFYTLRRSLRIPSEEETIFWSCAMPTLQGANQSRQTRDSMLPRFLAILKLSLRSLGMALIKNILFFRRTTTGHLDGSTKTKLLENACLQTRCTRCTFFFGAAKMPKAHEHHLNASLHPSPPLSAPTLHGHFGTRSQ